MNVRYVTKLLTPNECADYCSTMADSPDRKRRAARPRVLRVELDDVDENLLQEARTLDRATISEVIRRALRGYTRKLRADAAAEAAELGQRRAG